MFGVRLRGLGGRLWRSVDLSVLTGYNTHPRHSQPVKSSSACRRLRVRVHRVVQHTLLSHGGVSSLAHSNRSLRTNAFQDTPQHQRTAEAESGGAEGVHGHSQGAATANVVKSIMGAGCFALPWAYAQTGYVFTTVYMVASAGLCMYCLNMMQRAKTAALAKDPSKAELTTSYSGLAVATIGDLGGNITQLMVLVCCFGIASAYLVFVASTLATILPVSQTNLIIAITPVMVALAWLRSFSGVSLISLLGNVSVTVGMTAVLVYASKLGFNWTAVPAANIAAFPAAFGSVAFLFFVHFTMPPIEAAMAQPEKFYDASLNAFAISTVITATFGTIGAVCFGPMVPSVVITAMKGATVVAAVKLLLCLNLLCTFPIIVRGAFQILEGFMGGEENLSDPVIYSMRTVFVVLAAVCGVAIPSFGKLLGLVGGVSCTALTMIFPPIMLLATVKNISELEKIILYVIMAAGAGIAGLSIVS